MFIDMTLSIHMDDPITKKVNQDHNSYMSQGHIGTHLDVYGDQKRPPAEFSKRKGILIDVGLVDEEEIDEAMFKKHLGDRQIDEGDFIVFHTGYLQQNPYGTIAYFKRHPQFSWGLVNYLATQKLAFVGLDFAGMRRGEEHGEADRIMGNAGTYIIENMDNVGKLRDAAGAKEFEVITGWNGFEGFSGLACRVIANVQ